MAGKTAASISERAGRGEGETPDMGEQLFPNGSIEGDGISIGKFIKPGKENTARVKIKATRIPGGKGLADPEKTRTLLVTTQPGKVETIPHMIDGKVDRYETVQVYEPVFVEGVQRADAGRMEAMFKQLIFDDPKGAAKALDTMQAAATEALS